MNETGRTRAKPSNGKQRQLALEKEIQNRTRQLETASQRLAKQKNELHTRQVPSQTRIEQLPSITYVTMEIAD